MRFMKIALMVALVALSSAVAEAQSITGTITGRVSDPQGLTTPGVTVTASSPNLQGTRTAVTSVSGDYLLALLPPGAYTVTFDLSGFAPVEKSVSLAPTQVLPVDATLGPVAAEETVVVTGRSVDVLMRTAQVATNFQQTLIASLPTNRDINAALLLAPSVHPTGPLGAYSIAGAMSFQNLFMVNGVAVGDNLRGQPYDLYIEDAIQQTTIATAGISAEHGRFSGGVVNVVTKSGGNTFSGSFRDTLLNDRWRTLAPFEETVIAADPSHKDTRIDVTVPAYEYTLGGPVMRDRLWFFAAGRNQRQESGRTLVATNIPYTFESRQRRYEAKGTYSMSSNHRLQGSFIDSHDEQVNTSQNPATVMDTRSLYNSKRPMNLFSVEYSAILSPAFFLEARYAARNETLSDVGARDTDLINGTLLVDRAGRRYWAPTFCGVCGPEERDGQDLFVKGTYFLSKSGVGSHTMAFGYDGYNDKRFANNHQSGSDYRIVGTTAIQRGTDLTAQFLADGTTLITWQPIFVTTEGTNFRTHSAFYSDHWRVSDRVSANLGLRYDRNRAVDSSGQLVATGDTWSPRLGVILDPMGNQKWSVTGSVGKYVDALANTVADAASAAGNPDAYQFAYRGPDINRDTTGPLTSTADGLRQVFEWFEANGRATLPLAGVPNVRGVTPAINPSLSSPSVWEYAGGISRQFGSRAAVRADITYRDYGNFYALRTDTTTGRATDTRDQAPPSVRGRTYDLAVMENTDLLTRQYAGMTLQGQYRFGSGIDAGGNYTLSRAWGNLDGESPNGPAAAGALQYPEYKQAEWNYPEGDLAIDQRHRARLWVNYSLPWVSGLTVSGLQILESGVPYGAVSPSGVNPQPFVTNPGYLSAPAGPATQYYFTARDAFRTEGQRRTDLAVSYAHRVRALRNIQFFGQLQVLNVLNDFQLCACGASTVFQDGGSVRTERIDQTVRTPVTASNVYQAFNPFTTTPVEGVNWARGPNFGNAINRLAYTTPRTLRLTFGVRF